MTTTRARLAFFLTAGVLAVSSSAVMVRLTEVDSLPVAFWRVTLAIVLMSPCWLVASRREAVRALSRSDRWRILGAGVALGIHFWTWIASLAYTSVAASVLLVTTNPIWVGIFSPWVVGERTSRRGWVGIGIALAGAAVVTAGMDSGAQPNPLLGNGLALVGAMGASAYLMLGRRVRPHLDLWSYASLTLCGAWLVLVCGMLVMGGFDAAIRPMDWGLLLAMALVPQLVGHNAFNWALRYVKADVISVVLLLEPVGASLFALAILSEVPGGAVFFGGPLLLAGVFVLVTEGR